jgi:lipid-binding SYLF domain-containing protein
MKRLTIIFVACAVILAALPPKAGSADRAGQSKELVGRAAVTLDRFMADKEFVWFQENMKKAKAIMIFPRVVRAGFFWGGSGGNGVLVVRDEKTGEWSQPVFYSMGSVSYGLQIGGEEAEVIMLAMSAKAVDSLYASSFKFGGDVAVAAGPRGIGAKKMLNADFVSFARAKGLYAGLNLEGSGIKVRDDLNTAYYGREVRPVQVVMERSVRSDASEKLHQALKKAG